MALSCLNVLSSLDQVFNTTSCNLFEVHIPISLTAMDGIAHGKPFTTKAPNTLNIWVDGLTLSTRQIYYINNGTHGACTRVLTPMPRHNMPRWDPQAIVLRWPSIFWQSQLHRERTDRRHRPGGPEQDAHHQQPPQNLQPGAPCLFTGISTTVESICYNTVLPKSVGQGMYIGVMELKQ